jgi:HlyD family secretion protein
MQILVSVDESDIGQIKEGQAAHFTVQTYGSRRFDGMVRQVRLQSKTTENVVNYTVVVSVNNTDGSLLPGMTATVDFETARADSVLTVPNAALRFTPPASALKNLPAADTAGQRRPSGTSGASGATGASGANGARAGGARRPGGQTRGGMAQLWYLDASGKPAVMRVRTGISDGQRTQVSGPPELHAGLEVLQGVVTGSQPAASAQPSNNPFQPAAANRGGGRGP